MYEILKQYERIGYRILSVDELKRLLNIGKEEYSRFGGLKTYVICVCQKALAKYTDIKFTYEPHGKRGQGGKILELKFIIEKNADYVDQLTFDMFVEEKKEEQGLIESEDTTDWDDGTDFDKNSDGSTNVRTLFRERIELFMTACNDEFSFNDMVTMSDKLRDVLLDRDFSDQIFCYHYINDRYNEMLMQAEKRVISNRFGYLKSLVGKDV